MTDFDLYQRAFERPRIYVSGPMAKAPYTGPRAAFLLAKKLWAAGWHPIVPHANAAFELATGPLDPSSPDGIGGWLEYDFSMMLDCVALVRVTSEGMADVPSSGTDREVALAKEVGIIVFTEADALRGPDVCGLVQAYGKLRADLEIANTRVIELDRDLEEMQRLQDEPCRCSECRSSARGH